MSIFTQNPSLKNKIKERIACWLREPGVQICMDHGSAAFEQFIQVKLAGFFRQYFKRQQYCVRVESAGKYSADILIFNCAPDKKLLVAVQLKIVSLGKNVKMKSQKKDGILDDIDKLYGLCSDPDLKHDRVLICIVYQHAQKEKSWGPLKGTRGNAGYREELIQKLKIEHQDINRADPLLDKFGSKSGCIDVLIF